MAHEEQHFSFNKWWIGDNPSVKTPIQESKVIEEVQNSASKSQELKIVQGKVQQEVPEIEQVETVELTTEDQIINNRVLKPKTELNNINLTL